MNIRHFALAAIMALSMVSPAVLAAGSGDYARTHYTISLAGICPDPFFIQKDWLAQAEHGALYQLIGSGGEMSPGKYKGPLGATGIELVVLEGGGGLGLGDGETAYSSLFHGNSRADVMPHLGFQELDNAFIFSKRFPVVGIMTPLDKSPSALFWDRATYPQGFKTLDDLIAFGKSGQGRMYVSTVKRTFGKYLVEQGVPADAFLEGYRGDGELFVTNNGTWLNQGFVTNEVYRFETGNNWARPIDYLLISNLGYSIYTGMLSVAKNRMDELAPCLEKLVPLLQQAQVDYVENPAEINQLIVDFNDAGFGAGFWKTSPGLLAHASNMLLEAEIVSNGHNETIGDFDMQRVQAVFDLVKGSLDDRADDTIGPKDIVTNRFIDPEIGLKH